MDVVNFKVSVKLVDSEKRCWAENSETSGPYRDKNSRVLERNWQFIMVTISFFFLNWVAQSCRIF